MTRKDREDRFIDRCRKEFGSLTYESELLLRHGFAAGADELSETAYVAGVEAQRGAVLVALGAMPSSKGVHP